MIPNDAYLHLLLNHFPIIGGFLITLLLLYALATGSAAVMRAVLIMTVLISLVTIPVNESGHDAAGIVKQMPLIERDMIEVHEDRAEKAVVVIWITGGFAFLGLLAAGRGDVPKWVAAGTLALLLVSNGLLAWTARAGGQIHHAETRPDFVLPQRGSGGDEQPHGEHAH